MDCSLKNSALLPLLFLSLLLLSACSWQLHKPNADTSAKTADQAWYLYCEVAEAQKPTSAEMPKFDDAEWIDAVDSNGVAIRLYGDLIDGFLQLNDASSALTIDDLQQYCLTTIAALAHQPSVLASVKAARDGEKIHTSIISASAWTQPHSVKHLVIFGDSLSDTGNLKQRLKIFPDSPYWLGRFSNGPVWVDYLQASSRLSIQNHAYGGAFTVDHAAIPGEGIIAKIKENGQLFVSGSIQLQIDDYIQRTLTEQQMRYGDSTAFIIWAGANDYISKEPVSGIIDTFLNSPEGATGYQLMVMETIEALSLAITKLHAAGARKFVLMNLPDLGKTPIILQNTSFMSDWDEAEESRRALLSHRLTALTAFHNQALQHAMQRLHTTLKDSQILIFDSHGYFQQLSNDHRFAKQQYGFDFKNQHQQLTIDKQSLLIHQKCYRGGYLGSDDADDICAEQDKIFFWDVVHPASLTHCWLAYLLTQTLYQQQWIGKPEAQNVYRSWCKNVAARSQGILHSQSMLQR